MSSVLERLETPVRIPFDEDVLKSEDREEIAEYFRTLIMELKEDREEIAEYFRTLIMELKEILEKMTEVVNYGVDSNDGEAIYLGVKDIDGIYPIGTWRWIKVDSALQLQEKVTNTGVEADDWTKVASHSR
jgi:hypothetical protein